MIRALLKAIDDFIAPPLCPVCRRAPAAADGHSPCPDCAARVTPFDGRLTRCHLCGGLNDSPLECCAECAKHPRPWFRGVSVFPYNGPGGALIRALKYNHRTELVPYIGGLMAAEWRRQGPPARVECVIPVPLHWTRQMSRGFNQAQLLGEHIARELGIPCRNGLIRRHRTGHQARLSAAGRQKNLRSGFAVRHPGALRGQAILLVDDVFTTGATLTAAALALQQDGASELSVITAARA